MKFLNCVQLDNTWRQSKSVIVLYFKNATWKFMNRQVLLSFIWSIADLSDGHYKQDEYGRSILDFLLLCCLGCMLEATKLTALADSGAKTNTGLTLVPPWLCKAVQSSYSTLIKTASTEQADMRRAVTMSVDQLEAAAV